MQRAAYYQKNGAGVVSCRLCPHGCTIADGASGLCMVRRVQGAELYAEAYEQICSFGTDPVEKKPLYHFFPGEDIFSVGSWGCNFKCKFCQNWQISQQEVHCREMPADSLPDLAGGTIGVAYTYNEPYINFEYLLDSCKAVKRAGLQNVLVSNGYYNPEPLAELLEWVDAFNIDLKAFNDGFYQKMCNGRLQPVLESIKTVAASKAHLELTTLLIPGENDNLQELAQQAVWIKENCGVDVPLHLSAYFPQYQCNIPATESHDLLEAADIFRKELRHVYLGNINISGAQNTYCYECGDLLVRRSGYSTEITGMDAAGGCISCGVKNNFVLS